MLCMPSHRTLYGLISGARSLTHLPTATSFFSGGGGTSLSPFSLLLQLHIKQRGKVLWLLRHVRNSDQETAPWVLIWQYKEPEHDWSNITQAYRQWNVSTECQMRLYGCSEQTVVWTSLNSTYWITLSVWKKCYIKHWNGKSICS